MSAIELLEKALEQDETHFESIQLLYQAYDRLNRFEEALQYLNLVIEYS